MDKDMNTHVCAEVLYEGREGTVHSDICGNPANTAWREFLHANLDEWLSKSGGTGWFIVGAAAYNEDYESDILDRVAAVTGAGLRATP